MSTIQSASQMVDTFQRIAAALLGEDCDRSERCRMPSTVLIGELMDRLSQLLFPRANYEKVETEPSLRLSVPKTIARVHEDLVREFQSAFDVDGALSPEARRSKALEIAMAVIQELPMIRSALEKDLEEVMQHDPAAKGREEILLAYPGIKALTVYRLSHFMWNAGIPLIPRIMSELVHSQTGIDIHPGAKIAPYCSIDHGTGLIIGETTVIGEHANLFHNVTLGAKEVTPEYRGQKRHPTIGSNVIIYPGATILGDIHVGDNTVIGGNVFLLESCPANSKIFAKPPEMIFRKNSFEAKVQSV
jgi:serine O-acetyltransferase